VTADPVSVTTNEWSTISLVATATGIPNTYQWQKGNVDLVEVNNPDGTRHYPNGVTNLTLVISQVHPADAGQYRLVASNPVGGDTSLPANVVINADTTKRHCPRLIPMAGRIRMRSRSLSARSWIPCPAPCWRTTPSTG
jgi:hypothetical protein